MKGAEIMWIGINRIATASLLMAILGNSGRALADNSVSVTAETRIRTPARTDELAANDNAETGGCKDGDVITVSGEVGDIWVNKAGAWVIGVAHVVPNCMSEQAIVSKTRPPRSCSKGARLLARVQITDTLFAGFIPDKLVELTCE
jgi:hypothetical protein